MSRLKYVSNNTADSLRESVSGNAARYREGSFEDMMSDGEWSIELPVEVDLTPLEDLDPAGTSAAEVSNSKLVWKALSVLSPSLACEEGIWVRLTHLNCLDYARQRWLNTTMDDDALAKGVLDHFFADTLTKRRDDNAISRLWWNAYIASTAAPGDDLPALGLILSKADIRSNFIERSQTVSRPVLAAGIIRIMTRIPDVAAKEGNYRAFMRSVNRLGGGLVFEAMTDNDIDLFLDSCALSSGISIAKAA